MIKKIDYKNMRYIHMFFTKWKTCPENGDVIFDNMTFFFVYLYILFETQNTPSLIEVQP